MNNITFSTIRVGGSDRFIDALYEWDSSIKLNRVNAEFVSVKEENAHKIINFLRREAGYSFPYIKEHFETLIDNDLQVNKYYDFISSQTSTKPWDK